MKSSVVVYGLVGVLSLAMAVHGLDCAAGTYFFKRADGEPVCPECPSGFYCVGCTKCNDDWNSGKMECPRYRKFSNYGIAQEKYCGICKKGTMFKREKNKEDPTKTDLKCVNCPAGFSQNGKEPVCLGCTNCRYPDNIGMECPEGQRQMYTVSNELTCGLV